jgi:hypothetical protein
MQTEIVDIYQCYEPEQRPHTRFGERSLQGARLPAVSTCAIKGQEGSAGSARPNDCWLHKFM